MSSTLANTEISVRQRDTNQSDLVSNVADSLQINTFTNSAMQPVS